MATFTFSPAKYGTKLTELLSSDRLPELGPGQSAANVHAALQGLNVESLFGGQPIRDRAMAQCCLSGLWLWFDYLDESHTISQSIDTASGSFWHGIMHRREPDYSNAKYWFRRVANHPAYDLIAASTSTVKWDPFDFVDRCAHVYGSGSDEEHRCRELQRLEWQVLFDFCYDNAR